jgi:colanic acid biosynthesis glycosyl transferase WcaI
VCDYAGHAFPVQLSRELAGRGHEVLHLHFAEFQSPKGRLSRSIGDPSTLTIEAVCLGRGFNKYDLIKRRFQEIEIGRLFARQSLAYKPQVVLGILPLEALSVVVRSCTKAQVPFISWQQDIYSIAIVKILTRKYGQIIGWLVGNYYKGVEGSAARKSTAIIAITSDFFDILKEEFCVSPSKIHVIENWAPLGEILPQPKVNRWSLEHELSKSEVVLYTGTLGMKHDPSKLLAVAAALKDRMNSCMVVISEGPSAAWLAERGRALGLGTLKVLPFQPIEVYSEVLGTADVLISTLERDASTFSVPSKVLSYLCAARPIVLSAPFENLAAKVIQRSNSGVVVCPDDTKSFVEAVNSFLNDTEGCARCGSSARKYAEGAFKIDAVGTMFESILASVVPLTRMRVG